MKRNISLLKSTVSSLAKKNLSKASQFSLNSIPRASSRNVSQFIARSTSSKSTSANYFYVIGGTALTGLLMYIIANQNEERSNIVFAEEKKSATPMKAPLKTSLDKDIPTYRIVLTGGPCGGKSSAMTLLRERFTAMGFQVFFVSEIATLMLTGGARFHPEMDLNEILAFESALVKSQIALEECFLEVAKASKKPTLLICDRGALDPRAYMDQTTWEVLLEQNQWSLSKLRDRYDCIIHLVTAAIGAEKFYTTANNAARSETLEQARELDVKTRNAYLGHQNLHIVDNSTNFEGKIQRVINIVSRLVGVPKPVGIKRKILLSGPISNSQITVPYDQCEMEQVIVDSDKEQKRVRKTQTADGGISYAVSTKVLSEDGKEETVVFRPISGKNYLLLKQQQSAAHKQITKVIRTFLYEEHYFELVTYLNSSKSLTDPKNITCLCVEADIGRDVKIPDFLQPFIQADVTFDNKYSSFVLAHKH